MAGEKHFRNGNSAFDDKDYLTAKEEYSKAIDLEPGKAEYFLKRSECNAELNDFANAESDATKAVELDNTNINNFINQGTARYILKNYQQAKESFEHALKWDGENKNVKIWMEKCETEIRNEQKKLQTSDVQKMPTSFIDSRPIRHDWYQTEMYVVVSIMLKNCKREDVEIEFGKQNLSASVKLPNGRNYNLELDLAHAIVVEESLIKVLSTKIEIKMKKNEGIRWSSLEYKDQPKLSSINPQDSENASPSNSSVRSYPSSSNKYHDWNKLAANIEKDEKSEKKEGEAALNELFQKIYADANDETKRAMNKSFVESGGTVLSTNWKDIGSKKVECKAPDGMEFKKYEY